MMDIVIKITKNDLGIMPKKIKSLLDKFDLVAPLIDRGDVNDNLTIILDFNRKDIINDLSISLIWMFLKAHNNLKCTKTIKYKDSTKKYFNERHFFDSLTGVKTKFLRSKSVPINFESFEPVRPNRKDDQNDQINDIFKVLTKGILDTKNSFHGEVRNHMTECVQNAFDHSRSELGKKFAGTICTLKKNDFLEFCVVDMGQGIKKSILDNYKIKRNYIGIEDHYLISRATDKGISCNPSNNRHEGYEYGNGGIGLYYLREFIKLHSESRMVIISGKGYYYIDSLKSKPRLSLIKTNWPGTLVYFKLKLRDKKDGEYIKLTDQYVEEFDNKASK